MFGRNRDQAGILIEPSPAMKIDVSDAAQVAELRNKLWYVQLQSIFLAQPRTGPSLRTPTRSHQRLAESSKR